LTIPVIFTTAYDEYAIHAFKVNSIDYLLKPIHYDTLAAALDKYNTLEKRNAHLRHTDLQIVLEQMKRKEYKKRFMATLGSKIQSVSVSEIAYFFLDEKMTFLVTDKGVRLPISQSLDSLAPLLDPGDFFRVNRQYYIAHRAIAAAHNYSAGKLKITLQPAALDEVFVSGDRLASFKEWMGK
jgi:DNA-binding LytR/AlgR family response regulator